jgi:tRNA G10  N-methylase Trm11
VLDNTVPASRFWRSHQQHEHITLKELRVVVVRYAVESFVMPELANHIVQLYEDNQAVVTILMSGTSRSTELIMRELRKLFDICGLMRNITLRPHYIVRSPVSPECMCSPTG